MKSNVGVIDKIIRIVIALIFIVLYFNQLVTGSFGIVLLVLAGVFILTSIVGFCPLYLPFGINTWKKNK